MKHYRAALRQGTAATKNRKHVSGAGTKLWKQKGTGRARVGSIRTPLWRGGGTVHGPQPRSYEYQFPQKKLMGALRSAIAAKIADGKFTVVDTLERRRGKTKLYRTALNKLEARQDHAAGGVQPQARREAVSRLAQPARALSWCSRSEVHPYDLLRYEHADLLEGRDRSDAGDAEEGRLQAQQAAAQKEVA